MTPAERNAVLEEAAQVIQRAADNPLTRIGGGPEVVELLDGLAIAIRALKEQEPKE